MAGNVLLETGDALLLEDADNLLREDEVDPIIPATQSATFTHGVFFTDTVVNSGGPGVFSLSQLNGGTLPPGLSIDPDTGVLSGTIS